MRKLSEMKMHVLLTYVQEPAFAHPGKWGRTVESLVTRGLLEPYAHGYVITPAAKNVPEVVMMVGVIETSAYKELTYERDASRRKMVTIPFMRSILHIIAHNRE